MFPFLGYNPFNNILANKSEIQLPNLGVSYTTGVQQASFLFSKMGMIPPN